MHHPLLAAYAIFMGAWTACFIGCAAYRIPKGISLGGQSYCEQCRKTLTFDIFPVIGYLLLGGKCRFCAVKVPPVYPLTEAALAVIYYALYLYLGMGWAWFLAAAISGLLLYLAMCVGYFRTLLPLKTTAFTAFLILLMFTHQ